MRKRHSTESPNLVIINERIPYTTITLIGSDAKKIGIVSRWEALRISEEEGLDLILVTDKTEPPICRIGDYSREKYEKSKREKKNKKPSTTTKMLKMRYLIGDADYNTILKKATTFLQKGENVSFEVFFRGRERQHMDRGEQLLIRVEQDLKEYGKVFSKSNSNNKMGITLRPNKKK